MLKYLFQDSRLLCLHRADWRNSVKEFSFDKVQIWNWLYCKSNRNTLGFIAPVRYFLYHPWIAAFESWSLSIQNYQHSCPILSEFRHSSPPFCKNHKKPEVNRKIQACETYTLTKNFVFSCIFTDGQNSQYLVCQLWTGQNILIGGFSFKSVVATIIHHCYCMIVS